VGIYGQDWSSYQDSSPSTAGLSFAFTKITEGLGYTNPKWVSQRDDAKKAGLVWGGYHYPVMSNSPTAEGDRFLSKVDWKPGDLICLDWEGYDAANQSVSKSTQAAYKDAWLKHIKSRMPHNPVGMYCNVEYWKNVDTTSYFGDFLWIADPGAPIGHPRITAHWMFHQYGESRGLDLDYCGLTSRSTLQSWALSFSPPTEEDSLPFTEAQIRKFVNEEVVNAVTSAHVRDSTALALCQWLQHALAGDYKADPKSPSAWDQLMPKLSASLNTLSPGVKSQLVAAVEAAVKDSVVKVSVDVVSAPPKA